MSELNFNYLPHRIWAKDENGKVICEISFPEKEKGISDIESTFVDDDYRGQGLAEKLVKLALKTIEERGDKVVADCPYARKWIHNNRPDLNV